ncbi:MAG: hydrogenase maturation nickel metallochaperone HypA [Pseudomonadota bacterium]
MHELSVCQALLTQVEQIARTQEAQRVQRIVLAVGPLSGVEPALLASAFELARGGGCAAQAALAFEAMPVRVRCTVCGAQTDCAANRLLCGACGSHRTELISGDELCLLRIEFTVSGAPPSQRLN